MAPPGNRRGFFRYREVIYREVTREVIYINMYHMS